MKPAPFTIEELPLCDQGLKGWRLVQRMHEGAVAAERDTYVDPASGYTVFTSRRVLPCSSVLLTAAAPCVAAACERGRSWLLTAIMLCKSTLYDSCLKQLMSPTGT